MSDQIEDKPWVAKRVFRADELLDPARLREAQVRALNNSDRDTANFIGLLMRTLEYAAGKVPSKSLGFPPGTRNG